MPLTAPTSITFRRVSMSFIDGSGDKRSVSLRVPAGATGAQAQALATALGAASQANLYSWTLEDVHAENATTSGTGDLERDSVYDNVVMLFKNVGTGASQNGFIPAPVPAVMLNESDTPDRDNALFEAVEEAVEAILGSGWDGVSTRYTERREINDRVSLE